jgi:hypothetical protein
VANSWFELLSVVHLMAMLTLSEADSLMIPKDHSGSGIRVVSCSIFRFILILMPFMFVFQFFVELNLTRWSRC